MCFSTLFLHFSDIAVPIFSDYEGMSLRPAYATMALLSIYIFLPMRNNFLAILLGILVSVIYILIFALVTYIGDPRVAVVVSVLIVIFIKLSYCLIPNIDYS